MSTSTSTPLLQVQDLNIAFRTRQGLLPITRHVEFNIGVGERVGSDLKVGTVDGECAARVVECAGGRCQDN